MTWMTFPSNDFEIRRGPKSDLFFHAMIKIAVMSDYMLDYIDRSLYSTYSQ